jgi:hypothetical protein
MPQMAIHCAARKQMQEAAEAVLSSSPAPAVACCRCVAQVAPPQGLPCQLHCGCLQDAAKWQQQVQAWLLHLLSMTYSTFQASEADRVSAYNCYAADPCAVVSS